MATYYFHVRADNEQLFDEEGWMLGVFDDIVIAALMQVRALLGSRALGGCIDLRQHLDVENPSVGMVHSPPFVYAVRINMPQGPRF